VEREKIDARIFLRGKEKTIVPQSVPGERLDWKVQQGIILPLNARGEYKNGLFADAYTRRIAC